MSDIRAMQNREYLAFILVMLALAGCGLKNTDVKGYVKYLNKPENGLIQEKEFGAIKFKVNWMTPELMALNEMKKTSFSQKEWESVLNQYEGLKYCQLSISGVNGTHIYEALAAEDLDGAEIDEFLNFNGQGALFLTSGTDTAKCVLYTVSKTYGLAKQFDIAAGFNFEGKKPKDDFTLELDASFIDKGGLKFRFRKEDIDNIPILTI